MARSLELWGQLVRNVIFPSSLGPLVKGIRAGLAVSDKPIASNVLTQPRLPVPPQERFQRRMITVRDDSGPDDGPQSRRRFGINVWAENHVAAEDLALLVMAILRNLPDGKPITLIDELTGPFDPQDAATDLITVNGATLAHYYFAGRATVRGSSF